jgi:hypothetical protein
MNNLQLNYLVAQERIDDLALAAERYRLAQRVVNSGSQRRSFSARVLLRLRRRGTQVAAVRDARLAGAAQRSSLDGEARGLTISSADNITASPRPISSTARPSPPMTQRR